MNTHADSGNHNMQGRLRRASGKVVRSVAEKLQIDLDELRERRNGLLRSLTSQSERLVQGNDVPLPHVVKATLGRVNSMIDQWVDTAISDGQRHREQALHNAVHQDDNRSETEGKPTRKRQRKPTTGGGGGTSGGRKRSRGNRSAPKASH
jgi:hypothetical protein